jgi:hypothetical protein
VYILIDDHYLPGDIDQDSRITTADALIVLRHVIGTQWSSNVLLYGDVDGNEAVTLVDAILILRSALGLITL